MANGGGSTFSAAGAKGRGVPAAFCPPPGCESGSPAWAPRSRRPTPPRPPRPRSGPHEVIAALARGEAVDPSRYYFRTVMRFETADPALAWLNRILALGTGAREKLAVRLDVYEVV